LKIDEVKIGGKNITMNSDFKFSKEDAIAGWGSTSIVRDEVVDFAKEKATPFTGNGEVFTGEEEKSLDEIIKEVAQEEKMTEEEVRDIWKTFLESQKKKALNRPKRDKKKAKAKRKQANKSRRKNR
jgi:hypothetical protein